MGGEEEGKLLLPGPAHELATRYNRNSLLRGEPMKKVLYIAFVLIASILCSASDRMHLKILKVEEGTAQGAQGYYTPTRITIQMPDGTVVIGTCRYIWGTKSYHPCAYPNTEAEGRLKGDSIDLYWSASLEGKKEKTERYKIEQVIKPETK
jgi:hypothetical protein